MRIRRFLWVSPLALLLMMAMVACSSGTPEPTTGPAPTEAPAAVNPTEAPEQPEAPGEGTATYLIDPSQSEARFKIGEVLRGQDNLVIGATDQLEGQVVVTEDDLSGSSVSVITIGAGGFKTDSGFRDRAISEFILDVRAYPSITFEPTAIQGLPRQLNLGEEVELLIEGTLTIREIALPVTFEAVATLASENQMEGTATAVINRSDFELDIPSVPQVASVEEEVQLEIEFVALPAAP